MALKSNAFTPRFTAFNQQLVRLVCYQGFVRWQLAQAKAGVISSLKAYEKQGWNPDTFFSAHGLSLVNVFHEGHCVIRSPAGGTIARGEEILQMSDEMERKFNAFMLAYSFEAFKQYVTGLWGTFLFYTRSERTLSDKSAFHNANPKIKKSEGTQPYFNEYAAWRCKRNVTDAISMLGTELDMDRVLVRFYEIGIADYVQAIGFCRHAVVHNDGRIAETRLKRLSTDQRRLVELHLGNAVHGNEVMILPSTRQIDEIFEGLISYGWAFYILTTAHCRMRDDTSFFRDRATGKRRVQPK